MKTQRVDKMLGLPPLILTFVTRMMTELSAPLAGRLYHTRYIPLLISVRRFVDTSATELQQKGYLIWNFTRTLPGIGPGTSQLTAAQLKPSGANGIGGQTILRADLKVVNYVFLLTLNKTTPSDDVYLRAEWSHTLLTPALDGFEWPASHLDNFTSWVKTNASLFGASFTSELFVVEIKEQPYTTSRDNHPSPCVTAKRKICLSFPGGGESNPCRSAIIQSIQWKCSSDSED